MVEIKSGLLKDAHGQFDGMVIYHKEEKRSVANFPRMMATQVHPPEPTKHLIVIGGNPLSIREEHVFGLLVEQGGEQQEHRFGIQPFRQGEYHAYDTDYNIGDFRLLKFTVGTLQMPFHFRQQDAPEGILSIN